MREFSKKTGISLVVLKIIPYQISTGSARTGELVGVIISIIQSNSVTLPSMYRSSAFWSIIMAQTCEKSTMPSQVEVQIFTHACNKVFMIASSNLFCTHNIVMNYVWTETTQRQPDVNARYCSLTSI